MEIYSFIIITLILILYIKYFQKEIRIKKINKKIPGPDGVILLGNLLDLNDQIHETFYSWYKKYGKVYTIQLGNVSTVVLTEYDTLKEAFIDNSEIFQSRFKRKSRTAVNKGLNLANSNGEYFKLLKNTLMKEMRSDKLKKQEYLIKEQAFLLSNYFNDISNNNSGGISQEPINNIVKMYSMNVILKMIFNIQYPYSHNSYQDELISTISRYFKSTGLPFPSDFIPILYPILKNKPKQYYDDYESVKSLISKITKEYLENKLNFLNINNGTTDQQLDDNIELIESFEPNNILEALLKQFKLGVIPYDGVIATILDLILAGSDTTGNTILFALISLVNNPNVQTKLFNEISSQFNGDDDFNKLSYYTDRIKTPYLVAFIKEVKRYYPTAPIGVPHHLSEDCVIQGYHIAKGTQIIQNIYSTHLSPSFCSDPLTFSPERFIDNKNEPKLVSFGIGSRKCPGENIFEIEIYILLIILIKKFKFSNPSLNIDDKLNDRGEFGLALQCPQTLIKVELR